MKALSTQFKVGQQVHIDYPVRTVYAKVVAILPFNNVEVKFSDGSVSYVHEDVLKPTLDA